jgi:hypothetical protein
MILSIAINHKPTQTTLVEPQTKLVINKKEHHLPICNTMSSKQLECSYKIEQGKMTMIMETKVS